ncbi:enoyl-CoA hydratase/isomerase family protein [Rhodococcoides yunnanense]|uniref:Enoyl-CoA hydratase-related protein n=1 Tax=Rhodococcoides yunnanense TaxID=278209 RepID=A0ABU4BKD5_9NOCA|nr:enoyl-CoA hydratase-related protein [Rhodococcus yunnanensis]MDV6264646.1 enoyl-CoA hydratase-related protein [Rhodococcus yunnanensis]
MKSKEPTVDVINGVLRCEVSDASRGDSLNESSIAAAAQALRSPDSRIRAVLLVTAGKNFCNGGNVAAFASAQDPGEYVGAVARDFHFFIEALTGSNVPVIAAVRGWAAGAGMSIACASDIIVGSAQSSFLPAYSGIGFSPDGGMTWTLPRLVGLARARDLLLTNRSIDGDEAYRIGLLSRLVDDSRIETEAARIAQIIADGSSTALASIKQLLSMSATSEFSDQLRREEHAISLNAASSDGREGVAAFLARRTPTFS